MNSILEFIYVNKKLLIAVAIAAVGILNIQYFTASSATTCLGVADSKETAISFQSPVVVKRIFVLAGETVRKGQPLLEVEPVEVNMKLIELETQLQSLVSEARVRSSLLNSFASVKSTIKKSSPIEQEISGLQLQVEQLKKLQAQSVRYAEEDGVVASVTYLANEQVAPFQVIMTLTSLVPNLVFGFIHENYAAEFKVGDEVIVESITKIKKTATGKVASLGSRIVSFPERLQTFSGTKYWGRELIVSLPYQSKLLMGEKVQIKSQKSTQPSKSGLLAYAQTTLSKQSGLSEAKLLALGVPFEASGLVAINSLQSLLSVSDDDGPKKSPFWLHPIKNIDQAKNIELKGLSGIEDVESVTYSQGQYYAMSSLGLNKSDKFKEKRSLLIRFKVTDSAVEVDRRIEFRSLVIELVKKTPVLRNIAAKLEEDLDIESLSVFEDDAYLALKSPQMNDGTSIIFKIKDLVKKIEQNELTELTAEVFALVKLEDKKCESPSRISDLIKTKTGLIILSNCPRPDFYSQIWWLAQNAPAVTVTLVASLQIPKLEGMALVENFESLILSADRGNKNGSDFYQLPIAKSLYESQVESK
jgi:multidrug resistance efflux pump